MIEDDLKEVAKEYGNMKPINHAWLDEQEQRSQMAAAVALPADQYMALLALARNGLRPKLAAQDDWRDMESAPNEEWVIIATDGGWVGQACREWYGPNGLGEPQDGELRWFWAGSNNLQPIHEKHKPIKWSPMPKHPVQQP